MGCVCYIVADCIEVDYVMLSYGPREPSTTLSRASVSSSTLGSKHTNCLLLNSYLSNHSQSCNAVLITLSDVSFKSFVSS